uniref:Uncharacterized protein n=1 Tax=Anguilla anguilla TaxID=7936 RepID=A0A0E9WRQ2_ANGAN
MLCCVSLFFYCTVELYMQMKCKHPDVVVLSVIRVTI